MLRSELPHIARHLVHVLCVKIDAEAGVILPAYQPSLTELARDTALHRRTVQRYLNVIERSGWVIRNRPAPEDARRKHARTAYEVRIPAYPQARDSTPPELGTDGRRARDSMPRELGTARPEARGPVPHRSSVSSTSSGPVIHTIIKAIDERAGITVTPEWAAKVAEQLLGARDNIRNPEAYCRRVIAAAPPDTYAPHAAPPPIDEGSARRAAALRGSSRARDTGQRQHAPKRKGS